MKARKSGEEPKNVFPFNPEVMMDHEIRNSLQIVTGHIGAKEEDLGDKIDDLVDEYIGALERRDIALLEETVKEMAEEDSRMEQFLEQNAPGVKNDYEKAKKAVLAASDYTKLLEDVERGPVTLSEILGDPFWDEEYDVYVSYEECWLDTGREVWQVFNTLIMNSADHTDKAKDPEEKVEIGIDASVEDDYAVIRYGDNGSNSGDLDEQDLFTYDPGRDSKGLPLMKYIVEENGGELSLMDQGGSPAYEIKLPLYQNSTSESS